MENLDHILAQTGVLVKFNISRRTNLDRVNKIVRGIINKEKKVGGKKHKKLTKGELFRKVVMEDTSNTISKYGIPGLIISPFSPLNSSNETSDDKKHAQYLYLASLVHDKLAELKLDKYFYCYIVYMVAHMLELNESDFAEFHKRFSEYKNKNSN